MPTKNELFDRATRLLKASERYERETKDPFPRMLAKKAMMDIEAGAQIMALKEIETGEARMHHQEIHDLIQMIPSIAKRLSAGNAANRGDWESAEAMIIEAGLLD